eukprot:GCRY01001825.1.p1 GENE.GCRY01001825.1~~GCRY01001825.1.p1  ORF type:complete len:386 (-),score=75.32 GCRY01001825.1:47-1204(-)
MDSSSSSSSSIKRWRLLSHAIRTGKVVLDSSISVRRSSVQSSFKKTSVADGIKYELSAVPHFSGVLIPSPQDEGTVSVAQLMGNDNTGNICIWPSEEILADHLLHGNTTVFSGKRVLELGAGRSGLAGLCLSCLDTGGPKEVVLSDGNERCVDGLHSTILANQSNIAPNCKVEAAHLPWDVNSSLISESSLLCPASFDFIIMADCLFFREAWSGLVDILQRLLAPGGVVVSLAPRRHTSLHGFLDQLKRDAPLFDRFALFPRANSRYWASLLEKLNLADEPSSASSSRDFTQAVIENILPPDHQTELCAAVCSPVPPCPAPSTTPLVLPQANNFDFDLHAPLLLLFSFSSSHNHYPNRPSSFLIDHGAHSLDSQLSLLFHGPVPN